MLSELCRVLPCCVVLQPETTQKLKVVGLGMPDNHGGLVYWVSTVSYTGIAAAVQLEVGATLILCVCCGVLLQFIFPLP